ncbi:MAG TPA: hypothetical protein DDW31_03760 [candidate division Zixibacteria bacterium]|jgi:hypothetical protein|nr:hypothetical protein [candidate division Zixibacteria bacterium]
MKALRPETLEELAGLMAGEKGVLSRDGFGIVQFMQSAGLECSFYDGTDRRYFALKALKRYQDDPQALEKVILRLANPKEYKAQVKMLVVVANRLNHILLSDGLRIGFDGIEPKLVELAPAKAAPASRRGSAQSAPGDHPDFVRLTRDVTLSGMLESRMWEIAVCLKHKAHLAAIILMGTILEGVMLSVVHNNPKESNVSPKAPRDPHGRIKHFADWTLTDLAEVARERGWITLEENKFVYLLKEYRRLIHPWEQRARNEAPDEETCRECHREFLAALADIQKRC